MAKLNKEINTCNNLHLVRKNGCGLLCSKGERGRTSEGKCDIERRVHAYVCHVFQCQSLKEGF